MMKKKVGTRALLLFTLALSSCAAVEEIPYEEPQDTMRHVVLSASFAESAATKTALNEDFSVSFKDTDEITVFSGSTGYTFSVATISEDGLTATFEGDIVPASSYYAIYPKDESASITEGGIITTTLPTSQIATAGSFGDGANLSIAKSSDGELHFMNVGAIVSVSVKTDGVEAVTLSSDNVLAGPAAVSFASGVPAVAFVEGSNSVTLTGGLTKDTKYYFVVYPGMHANGLKLTFFDEVGNRAIFNNSKSVEFTVNDNVFLGSIAIPDTKWIEPAVGYMTSSTIGIYDTDFDLLDYGFDRFADQLAVVKGSNNAFRMQNLNKVKYIEIYGIPATYAVGDSFNVRILQNYVQTLDENFSEAVTVEKIDGGLVWLQGANGKGYIIKQ